MPSNGESIEKTVNGELFDAAAAAKKYFELRKGRVNLIIMNHSLNEIFREPRIEGCRQRTEEKKGNIRGNPKVKSLIERAKHLEHSIKGGNRISS
jgi:hypothetical protein